MKNRPTDEPYLGRESLLHFDNVIISCLEANAKIAPQTHILNNKSDLQRAACQIIPQTISLALSIRELIRQGYLFGASVLIRTVVERCVILLFLHGNYSYKKGKGLELNALDIWKRGWKYAERPSLAKMIEIITNGQFGDAAQQLNSLVHGDPESALWNMVQIEYGKVGYSVSKIVDEPEFCDRVCYETVCWLVCILGEMVAIFPDHDNSKATFAQN
jgi:hypothetical protein